MTKFKEGDKVRIINYGHLTWHSGEGSIRSWRALGKQMMDILIWGDIAGKGDLIVDEKEDISHLIYSRDPNGGLYTDSNPKLVGKTGVIEKVSMTQGIPHYSIIGIPEKVAWYDEGQLELYE